MTDTLMRQYDPDLYDNTKAMMLDNYFGEPCILRLAYDPLADCMRYFFATTLFYATEGKETLTTSLAWERYNAAGQMDDHFETQNFFKQLRRKAYQKEAQWNPVSERVEAAAQQASLGCIPKGTIVDGPSVKPVFKAGSLADYYFTNLLENPKLTDAQLRELGRNAQKVPKPELWWQTEQRLAAFKRDEVIAMRADIRRMLMGG